MAHRLGGMFGHADDLGGNKGLRTRMTRAERGHDVLVAGDEDLEVGIGLKCLGDALEHDLGLLVPTHGINADASHTQTPFNSKRADP